MFAFKEADLQINHESLIAYTAVPPHPLKSVAASTMRFLDRSMSRKSRPTQPMDASHSGSSAYANIRERDAVEEGLKSELKNYLHEPRADLFKTITDDQGQGSHVVWCDPLWYWMARAFLYPKVVCLSPVCIGCRGKVSVPLSPRDGYPPSASICSSMRTALLLKQGDMYSAPEQD